jgi:hypothetical protein
MAFAEDVLRRGAGVDGRGLLSAGGLGAAGRGWTLKVERTLGLVAVRETDGLRLGSEALRGASTSNSFML